MSISQKFKEFIAPMDEDDVLEVEQEEDCLLYTSPSPRDTR